MGYSGSVVITLDVATEAMPNEMMADISEQKEENMSTRTFLRSAFSSKVMRKLIAMQSRDDMAFLRNRDALNVMKMLESSSVNDIRFCGNEKMRELMERRFSSSVDDMTFCGNTVHIMHYELYEAVCNKNVDADKFVDVLEQVCTRNEVDLATIFFNHVTPTGDSLLHVAAQHGIEQVLCLIAFHYPKLLYKTNVKGDTPLHVAARAKNVLAIKNILDMDKHFLTFGGEEDESKDRGEFIMLRNNYGRAALHEAVLSMDYSVVLFLLLAHEQSDLTSYWTWNYSYGSKSPMYLAVRVSAVYILDLLLRLIPIPSGKAISNGDSPLHAAISERHGVRFIIDRRQELLYQRDENNNTPLHYAAYNGYMGAVCVMLETVPMVSFQRNLDGNLPIHLACEQGYVEMVKKLLEIKEWSNAGLLLNNKGQNILHIAAMKGRTRVIKFLLKHPKIHHDTINERDVNGDTPLHLAARELRLWTLLLLSRHKMIDVDLVNNEGFTAIDVVWRQRRIPMTRQEYLAYLILLDAEVPWKENKLGIPLTTSINEEWNVKEASNTLMLMAILIATVTFTAGFTVPGGFYSSDGSIAKQRGLALLSDQTLFKIFMIFNTLAMCSSTISSIILLWVPIGGLCLAEGAYSHAMYLLHVALLAMPVAFVAAVRLIVSNNTLLANVISIIGVISISFIIFVGILGVFPYWIRRPVFRQIAGLLIRIIVASAFGRSDVMNNDLVAKVNQVNQVDARNQII